MANSKIATLSHRIDQNTPTYGNREKFIIEEKSEIKKGETANSSKWTFSSNHLGSHIDMPSHFFENGATLTDYPIEDWIFNKVQLIEIPCDNACLIKPNMIKEKISKNTDLLLIKTGFEKHRNEDKYWNDNPGLSSEVGFWLRENYPNLRVVGFDFISITSWLYRKEGREAHKSFLDPNGKGEPILILEDLSLKFVNSTIKKVIIAPVLVVNSNGSPVTVFAEFK